MRTWVRSLSSLSGLSAMRCGVLRRHGLDPKLLWLWCRPSAAALIQSLAWELPYAKGLALKKKRKKRLELCTGRLSENGLSVQGNNSLQTRFPLSRFPKKISCHIDSHGGQFLSLTLSKYIQNPVLSVQVGRVPATSYLDCCNSP